MEIDTLALTNCEVAADGGAVSLGFVDSQGRPATIRLSLNQVGALAMTLPGLIDKALQTRFGDQSLRYAYPLASWVVEQSSDPTQGMVTLRTVDGFSVCFSILREQQSELGEALVAQPAAKPTPRANCLRLLAFGLDLIHFVFVHFLGWSGPGWFDPWSAIRWRAAHCWGLRSGSAALQPAGWPWCSGESWSGRPQPACPEQGCSIATIP